jgi:histidine ammonia-lyase
VVRAGAQMSRSWRSAGLLAAGLLVAMAGRGHASAQSVYRPITPSRADRTVTLTGRDLSIEQVVEIARHGAKVQLSPEARERAKDSFGLFLEAAAEGVPVYLFNRGGGNNREVVAFTGDPTSPDNKARIEQNQLRAFQNGARSGAGAEQAAEEAVRAMMAVRANTIVGDAPSPQLMQMLLDLLNNRITPVVRSGYGSVGEADLSILQNVAATMVGRGEAYLNGVRMPAAEALQKAGLKPIQPFGADITALTSTNAYTASQAALLVADARAALEWADLIYGMDMLGMNSSITPLARPTQLNRPDRWLNWHAARMLELLKGSYLFEADPKRIIQDPDSLRASSIRQGATWQAWAELSDAAVLQINSSDHNPGVRVGVKPGDSWELSSPMMMQYFVKGGPHSGGKSGYVLSNANWDPYPLANRVEAFTLALGNLDVAVVQRIYKFAYPFHTGIRPADALTPEQLAAAAPQGNGATIVAYWGEVEAQLNPVPPLGVASDNQANGDIESQLPLKLAKSRKAVDATWQLLAHDLMTAAYWLDVRKAQDPKRGFGAAPTAVWAAYRKLSPWQMPAAERPERPAQELAFGFMTAQPAASFYSTAPSFPR